MTVLPLSYAGGQQPSYNLTLMRVGEEPRPRSVCALAIYGRCSRKMAEDNVMVLVHGYLAGGFVGKEKCVSHQMM